MSITLSSGRSSTGSNPFLCPSSSSSSGGNRQSGSGSIHSRSSSASSQGSVESIIEEFEERKRSFERLDRKHIAPEPTTCQYNGGRGSSPVDAARGKQRFTTRLRSTVCPLYSIWLHFNRLLTSQTFVTTTESTMHLDNINFDNYQFINGV